MLLEVVTRVNAGAFRPPALALRFPRPAVFGFHAPAQMGRGTVQAGACGFGNNSSFLALSHRGQYTLHRSASEETRSMLLSRDFVAYMAAEVVKRLCASEMIEAKAPGALVQRIRQKMAEELSIEDRLNDEVREILNQHADEMRRTGASYQEMYKKVKAQLARERKLILR